MSDKTIAKQLGITKFPFSIENDNGNQIYCEDSDGYWEKREFDDALDELVYLEESDGYWEKVEFDDNGNNIYIEDSDGYWWKREFDDNGNVIYTEDSDGYLSDNRPKSKAIAKVTEARKPLQQAEQALKEVCGVSNKTIAQQLGITKFPFEIKDDNGNEIYFELLDGFWRKSEYDHNDNLVHYQDSHGFWNNRVYDSNNNKVYFENSDGYWWKGQYDHNDKLVYREDSDGDVKDNKENINKDMQSE